MHSTTPSASTWWSRHWKWCVPVLAASLLVLLLALLIGLMALLMGAMKSSGPYQHAVQRAQTDPAVVAALGAPIEPGWFVQGNISVTAPAGKPTSRFRCKARAPAAPCTWSRRSRPASGATKPSR